MTLNLSFFHDETTRAAYQSQSFEIVEQSGTVRPRLRCRVSSGGQFRDSTYVEARLENCLQDPMGCFRLQLAYKPDYKPISNPYGYFVLDQNNPVTRLQLLRGACGLSVMRLRMRASSAADWGDIFSFEIEVEPAPEKRDALVKMVDELLMDRPLDVISQIEGLAKTRIGKRWIKGEVSSDWWSALIKYDEMCKMFQVVSPLLKTLQRNASVLLIRGYDRMNVQLLKRITRVTVRDMKKKGSMRGRKVLGAVVRESYDTPMHRAIKDFLQRFRRATMELRDITNESLDQDRERLNFLKKKDEEWESEGRKKKNIWEIEDKEDEKRLKEKMFSDLEEILCTCSTFLHGNYPWVDCTPVPIVQIPIDSVPISATYRCLYSKILEFVKKRFFWSSVEGHFVVPKYVRYSEGEPSSWQKNYSYIYEVWVFRRLLEAFTTEGFGELSDKDRQKTRSMLKHLQLGPTTNEPVHAEMSNGKMRIDIFYGLCGFEMKEGDRWSEFTVQSNKGFNGKNYQKKSIQRLTPDFAIVFTNPKGIGEQSFHWIVLDAKSGRELREENKNNRDLYFNKFCRYGEPPDQSWLVYSGDFDTSPGIEFDNDWLTWDDSKGIEGWTKRRVNAMGNLRVNVLSVRKLDVFRLFARGQIATAMQRMGIQN